MTFAVEPPLPSWERAGVRVNTYPRQPTMGETQKGGLPLPFPRLDHIPRRVEPKLFTRINPLLKREQVAKMRLRP